MLAWNYDIHVANNPITAIINLNKMQEILPNEKKSACHVGPCLFIILW